MTTVGLDDFKKLDLRIALVRKVEAHPNADRLYVITVEIGGEERVIVAGIRNYYGPEDLLNKKVVVITNILPSVIRGVESNGMLLAVKDSSTLAVLTPERDVATGSPVS